jgi:hypothetical protein
MKKTLNTILNVIGYAVAKDVFVIKVNQIWVSYCSHCGLQLMHHDKLKDAIPDLKSSSKESIKELVEHFKSHNKVPKTIRKGNSMKKLNLTAVLDAVVKEFNLEAPMPKYETKELDMNFVFDLNYIPNSKDIGNVSGYYVDRTIDPEMEALAKSITKPKGVYTSNIMLNWDYDYTVMPKELGEWSDDDNMEEDNNVEYKADATREDEQCEYDVFDTLDKELAADAFLEDIVRGKYVPKGLAGANKIIGFFMSNTVTDCGPKHKKGIETTPIEKMYAYCNAVHTDKATMELIKFKLGAKLPKLEDSESVPFMDHIYNPDNGGIADESKTHKSFAYLRHIEKATWWLIHNKKSCIDQIMIIKNEMKESELEYWRYMLSDVDKETGENTGNITLSKYVIMLCCRAKGILKNHPELWESYYEYISTLEAKKPDDDTDPTPTTPRKRSITYKDNYKPVGMPIVTPSTDAVDNRPRLTIKVFPNDINSNLKEGFLIGGVLCNGTLTQYISGRSFNVSDLCKRVVEKFGHQYQIKFVTMDAKTVSYKDSWNSFCSYTRTHQHACLAL